MTTPFGNPVYRRLFSAQITSLVGTGVTTIALALLAWDLAGNEAGEVLGTALALKMVVYVFVAPVMGAYAHKLPRRAWLVSLDLARIAIVLCLPFVTEVWQIYVLIVLLNSCAAGFTPVFQATIPDVIRNEEQYQKALSYTQMAYSLEQVISPSLAAMLLTVMSYTGLFVLDALTFLLSAFLVMTCALPAARAVDRSERVFDNLRFGVVAYLRTPRLRATWAMYFAVACASGMVIVNTVIYVRDYLGRVESDIAWAVAASGSGAMVAAFLVPGMVARWQIRKVMLTGGVILAISLLVGQSMPDWYGFLIIWFCMGAGLATVQTPVGSLVRRSCHESDSPALFAANFSLSHFCWFGSYLLAGYLGSLYGLSVAFLVLGLIAVVAMLIAWAIFPNPDPVEIEHTHDAMEHDHHHRHDDVHHPPDPDDHGHEHPADSPDGHRHPHRHKPVTHKHPYVIDRHHPRWAGN
ncbi:MAG: MFS transporter [Pseudomonadales bacterium]|nr:MFS transporter [Pseudomonadales bacterium]